MNGPARNPEEQPPGIGDLPSAGIISQHDDAQYLGVSPSKIGWLVFRQHLAGTRHGVTASSLRTEKRWRATASPAQRIRRVLADALRTVRDGF